ncbi:MAG: hypothetical protein QME94_00620, partial [Anaerolineae bacterium]|nr:hypothetical protein [Anaerolineae bacterium]
ASGEEKEEEPIYWLFLPVSEHLKVDGVRAAARIGSFRASMRLGAGEVTATLVGIDRVDYQQVGFFRRDFAPREPRAKS